MPTIQLNTSSRVIRAYHFLLHILVVMLAMQLSPVWAIAVCSLCLLHAWLTLPKSHTLFFSAANTFCLNEQTGVCEPLEQVNFFLQTWHVLAIEYRQHQRRQVIYFTRDMCPLNQWKQLQRYATYYSKRQINSVNSLL